MHRSRYLAALLAALMLPGCGQSSSPPPPANTPAQPLSNAAPPENTPPAQTSADETANPSTEAKTAGQESSLTSGKASPPLAADEDNMPADDEAALKTKTPSGEPADSTSFAGDEDAASARPRSNRPARKLLRGLASSLTRALSKAASASAQSGDENDSDSSDKPRPAPKLQDDPFPNGEPADNKPADNKPSETKPDE